MIVLLAADDVRKGLNSRQSSRVEQAWAFMSKFPVPKAALLPDDAGIVFLMCPQHALPSNTTTSTKRTPSRFMPCGLLTKDDLLLVMLLVQLAPRE